MVAQVPQIAELDHRQLFEYLTNILTACMPECFVSGVQIEGKPDAITGDVTAWHLVGTVTRKINLGHTKKFSVPFNPSEEWTDKKLERLMKRLVPSIRQSFETNLTLKVTR